MMRMFTGSTRVVGVTKTNANGSSRRRNIKKCSIGEVVKLVREPNNRYDRNAVMVCRTTGEQLGYLNKDFARDLAEHLYQGGTVSAEIADIYEVAGTGGWFSSATRGVLLTVAPEDSS